MWSPFWKFLARVWLRVFGWTAVVHAPLPPRFVMIAAPHTTNWDLPFMLAVAIAADVKIRWMGKHTLFGIPLLGRLLTYLGGIPVVRNERHNTTQQMIEKFRSSELMALAVQPEGTRKLVPRWRSGFYRIAHGAGVPIVPGFLDYTARVGGFGPSYLLTGDRKKDMDHLREFYKDKRGKYPELFGPVRLEDEDLQLDSPGTGGGPED
ncbi:MAG: 1-acyl-sn-glycerol-3-phosphate acyltransferase [Candidatus Riflebacteria bacterium]|nr:1-acyl-sn-glycerol-3-phosphate acyltransferase [Candidatus Riflebacteria bacterium]